MYYSTLKSLNSRHIPSHQHGTGRRWRRGRGGGGWSSDVQLKVAVTLICRSGIKAVCCVTTAVIREQILWLPLNRESAPWAHWGSEVFCFFFPPSSFCWTDQAIFHRQPKGSNCDVEKQRKIPSAGPPFLQKHMFKIVSDLMGSTASVFFLFYF